MTRLLPILLGLAACSPRFADRYDPSGCVERDVRVSPVGGGGPCDDVEVWVVGHDGACYRFACMNVPDNFQDHDADPSVECPPPGADYWDWPEC